jgi:hypothetical protein
MTRLPSWAWWRRVFLDLCMMKLSRTRRIRGAPVRAAQSIDEGEEELGVLALGDDVGDLAAPGVDMRPEPTPSFVRLPLQAP